jgi:hypothetical protein
VMEGSILDAYSHRRETRTLGWKPETELSVVPIDDEVSSHALIGAGGKVRVIPAGEKLTHQGSEIHPQGRIAATSADWAVPIHAGPLESCSRTSM